MGEIKEIIFNIQRKQTERRIRSERGESEGEGINKRVGEKDKVEKAEDRCSTLDIIKITAIEGVLHS